ncbi:DNA cytosine methyltransferase [Mycoplasmopsis hyopharyngis]|uniref:DNA cytosine methyltransferase n=1 Tax=Mycoplasmopsis hyopharyngis TaxID=29558 RepID=UPI003873A47B
MSQQGKQKGINKDTRSGLLLEVERILENNKNNLPKVLLLENVKALGSNKFKGQFLNWIDKLNKLGYVSNWKIVNSKDYGSVQNRERVFCVSILKQHLKKPFVFPKAKTSNKQLSDIIKFTKDDKTLDLLTKYSRTEFKKTKAGIIKAALKNYTKFNSENYIYSINGTGPTLTASGANSRIKFYSQELNILRYIKESEAFEYMGFDFQDYLKVKNTNLVSASKMLFLCGNSISVEALEEIFKEIIECLN